VNQIRSDPRAPRRKASSGVPGNVERWGFSVTMLTLTFAVYVTGLLSAVLTIGSLSALNHRPTKVLKGFEHASDHRARP
jgi:hypothetical protein